MPTTQFSLILRRCFVSILILRCKPGWQYGLPSRDQLQTLARVSACLQVMDVVDNGGGSETSLVHTAGLELGTSGRAVVPALGLAWANCVNTRLFLSRQGDHSQGRQTILRSMQVVFSPSLPQSYCYFRTTARGVFGISADEMEAPRPTVA